MLDGVLLINKSAGPTSHDVVQSLRKIFKQKSVGHGGTLDPIAEGLLLILMGRGTKLSPYLLNNDKKYAFTFQLGVSTDTWDKTGQILSKKTVPESSDFLSLAREELLKAQGHLTLPVPSFSAVKIKGRKLYEYMREGGKSPPPPKREMHFYDLKIKNLQKDKVSVELSCTKGSYIRSWVDLIGRRLKTGAVLEKLTRLVSEPFHIQQALTVDQVSDLLKKKPVFEVQELKSAFIPFSQALPHITPLAILESRDLSQGRISPDLLFHLKPFQQDVNIHKKGRTLRIMSANSQKMLALLNIQPFKMPQFLRVFK